ncbi:hypothetical protein Tco_0641654 [Tanacetum coccineum]
MVLSSSKSLDTAYASRMIRRIDVRISDSLKLFLYASKHKTNKRQPGTRGSNEGTGVSPGVLGESTVVPTTSSEGTGTKLEVPDEEKVTSEEKVILEWGSEQESEYSEEDQGDDEEVDWIDSDEDEEKKDDTDDDKSDNLEMTDDDKSIDLEMTDDEETNDEFVHYVKQVNDDEDEEMTNDEVEESGNDDEENTDAAKMDAKKIKEIKDDAKKAKLPPTSSSLSISLGFGDQFLKLSSDNSIVSTIKDTTDAEINSLLDIKIQYEVPHIQSPSVLRVPVFVIFEPLTLTQVQETPLVAPVTTLPPPSISTIPHVPHQTTTPIITQLITTDSLTITTVMLEFDALTAVQLRVAKLEKDMFELKKIDHSAKALSTLKSQVTTVIEKYLRSKIGDDLQKVLQRHTADLIQKYSVKPAPKSSKIQKLTTDLEQGFEKSALEILKIKREQAEKQKMPKNPANHASYHALMKALIEDENAMDKGIAYTVKNHKRKHDNDDDDEYPPKTPKGKAPSKGSKTDKSASAMEPVEEPIAKVVMNDAVNTAGEDVVRDDDQPQDTSEPKTNKTPNQDWFKQSPRPPTPDSEWNKCQVVLDQPKQPWFNQMVSAINDPLTFNDLMATPIDSSSMC